MDRTPRALSSFLTGIRAAPGKRNGGGMGELIGWIALPYDQKWDEPVDDWWATRLERRLWRPLERIAFLLTRR